MSVYSYDITAKITTSVATSQEFTSWGESRYGMIYIPVGSGIGTLTVYVAPEPGGTYLPLYVGTTLETLTVTAGRAYQLPMAVQGARAIRLVADAVNGTGELIPISFQEQ